MLKNKFGSWFLWSLIPNGILGFICTVITFSADTENPEGIILFFGLLMFISWPTWWLSLIVGIILKGFVRYGYPP